MIFYALHVSLFPGIPRLLEMLCLFTFHFYFTGFWPSSCFHWVKVVRGELGVKRKSDSFSLSPPSALHQDLNFCLHRTNQHMGRVQSTFQAAEHFTSGDVLFFSNRAHINTILSWIFKQNKMSYWSRGFALRLCCGQVRHYLCLADLRLVYVPIHTNTNLLTWRSACVYDKCGLYWNTI